jgi:Archaeal/vacuolar-type H+-ATPase subunit A
MLKLILECYHMSNDALNAEVELNDILSMPVREQIGRSKYISESEINKLSDIMIELKHEMNELTNKGSR